MSKLQNMNAVDVSCLESRRETYHLFTLVIHSVRTVSRRKEKRFFAVIKLSATINFFFLKNLKIGTASTTNTPELDDLHDMCPTGFDVHTPIKPSSAITHTYGGGVIKSVGQIELICETQRKRHNLLFQLLSLEVMGTQSPLLSGSDCLKLGRIENKGDTPSPHHHDLAEGAVLSQA